ncbi:slipin family protein, partial [Candidatus Gracilibacteria bacterium]|nr:slipin family protein [Candidatus Gracilibacteria bacterium]
FTLGKFSAIKEPGWKIVIPVFQELQKVDIRVKAVDVPDQEAITKDNISISINAVIYYKIIDTSKAVIEVENFFYAMSQLAQTTMRNIVGGSTLDQLLQERESIANSIETFINKAAINWGIEVVSVELKDIRLPETLKRTMAKEAEAEREKRAVIVNSLGEKEAAANLAEAAALLATTPGALHLRTLQSINDISSDQSNTTIWMVPNDGFKVIEALSKMLPKS